MLPDTVRQSLIILYFWEGQEIKSRGTQSKSHAILYIKLKKKTEHCMKNEMITKVKRQLIEYGSRYADYSSIRGLLIYREEKIPNDKV